MSTTEEKILIGVSRLRNLMHREMESHFREYGLTSAQFSVLEALNSKGELTVGKIQELILGTPGNVPVIINNLVKDGYVTKTQDAQDRRVSRIAISDAGHELIKAWLEDILDALSEDEKKELASVLVRSYQKISKHRGGSEEKE